MRRFTDIFRLFILRCRLKIARNAEFRIDFIAGVLMSFIFSCTGPLFQFLLYSQTKGFPGWSFQQIIVFQAVLLIWLGLVKTLFSEVKTLINLVVQYGVFDRILLNPISPLVLILTHGFNHHSMGTLFAGIAALIYVIIKFNIMIVWWQIALFIFFLIAGIFLYLSFIIFYCSLALKLVYVSRIYEILERIMNFGQFPAEIFSGVFKMIYLIALPIAVWIYFPAQVILGRLDILALYGTVMSFVLFFASVLFWNTQVKNYTSSGG